MEQPLPLREGKYPKLEIEWSYPISNYMPAAKGSKRAERDIDPQGRYLRYRLYAPNGALQASYAYEYEGRLRKCFLEKTEGRFLEYIEHLNDKNRVQRRFRFRHDGTLLDSTVYEYNPKDLNTLLAERLYDAQGTLLYQTQWFYDDVRPVCVEHQRDMRSGVEYETNITLDVNTRLPLLRRRHDQTGSLMDKTEMLRDAQGNLLEKRYYRDGRALDMREVYEFNSAKNQYIWTVYAKGGAQMVEYTVIEYKY